MMEEAIAAVESKNDDSKVHELLEKSLNPFKEESTKS